MVRQVGTTADLASGTEPVSPGGWLRRLYAVGSAWWLVVALLCAWQLGIHGGGDGAAVWVQGGLVVAVALALLAVGVWMVAARPLARAGWGYDNPVAAGLGLVAAVVMATATAAVLIRPAPAVAVILWVGVMAAAAGGWAVQRRLVRRLENFYGSSQRY